MAIDSEIREIARDVAREVLREELTQLERALEAKRPSRPAVEPLLTVQAVADLCGVSTKTVQRWIARGLLRAMRSPGMREYRITQRDYEAFTRTTEPVAPAGRADARDVEKEASRVLAAMSQRSAKR